jgi:hypothetical protein
MRQRITTARSIIREPSLSALLVLQMLVIFAAAPLVSFGIHIPESVIAGTFVLVVLITVAASSSITAMVSAIFAMSLSAAAVILRQQHQSLLTDCMGAAGTCLAIFAVNWVVIRTVFSPGRMNIHRVLGAVVLYLNFAMLFAALYRLIAETMPGAFSGMPPGFNPRQSLGELMYLSIATLTTVGYGDIAPVNPLARSLSNLEAITGQLYPAIILARIVTLYRPKE